MWLSFHILSPGMRVYVRLAAHLRGRVGGLCGNFDGDTENDFTTRQGIVESTAELFGNSWKVSPSCPDVADQDLRDPCAVSSTQTRLHTVAGTFDWDYLLRHCWESKFAVSLIHTIVQKQIISSLFVLFS